MPREFSIISICLFSALWVFAAAWYGPGPRSVCEQNASAATCTLALR